MRLDLAVANKYGITRTRAQEYIAQGMVFVNGSVVRKSSFQTEEEIELRITTQQFVGRGGFKLKRAIAAFGLDFNQAVVVDIGASTGGFTDCALQNGAQKVYAIDVGTDQLDETLRNDKRVISMEKTNFKDVTSFPELIDYYVMDVSFVSISEILPHIAELMKNAQLVTLIKPQFEVGKGMTKKGIVKDKKMHFSVLSRIIQEAQLLGLKLNGLTYSGITGKSGNIEYLALFSKNYANKNFDYKKIIDEAHQCLG